jgi:hypothetical protein
MRKLIGISATTVLALALTAPFASAATEIGSNCTAASGGGSITAVSLKKAAGDPLAITSPITGLITKWKVNVIGFPGTASEKLKVFRPTANPNAFDVVAESALSSVAGGPTSFDASIPINAGDRIGVSGVGTPGLLYCNTGDPNDSAGFLAGEPALNTVATFAPTPNIRPAISATIEADADGDGFGDETQDKCPRSKALQTECPTISLGAFSVVTKSSLLLLVTSTSAAPVSVSGEVKVPVKKGKAKASASRTIKLTAAAQTAAPGQIISFKLPFPKALKSALAALPPKKSLKLTAAISATDLTGLVSSTVTTAKLKGQAR